MGRPHYKISNSETTAFNEINGQGILFTMVLTSYIQNSSTKDVPFGLVIYYKVSQ